MLLVEILNKPVSKYMRSEEEQLDFSPEEIKSAIQQAKTSSNYKELLKLAEDISSPAQIKHGTFAFRGIIPDLSLPKIESEDDRMYTITASGYLRGGNTYRSDTRHTRHPTPQLTKDLVENYKLLFDRLINVLQKRFKKKK